MHSILLQAIFLGSCCSIGYKRIACDCSSHSVVTASIDVQSLGFKLPLLCMVNVLFF